jgi:hypothetical protein
MEVKRFSSESHPKEREEGNERICGFEDVGEESKPVLSSGEGAESVLSSYIYYPFSVLAPLYPSYFSASSDCSIPPPLSSSQSPSSSISTPALEDGEVPRREKDADDEDDETIIDIVKERCEASKPVVSIEECEEEGMEDEMEKEVAIGGGEGDGDGGNIVEIVRLKLEEEKPVIQKGEEEEEEGGMDESGEKDGDGQTGDMGIVLPSDVDPNADSLLSSYFLAPVITPISSLYSYLSPSPSSSSPNVDFAYEIPEPSPNELGSDVDWCFIEVWVL